MQLCKIYIMHANLILVEFELTIFQLRGQVISH